MSELISREDALKWCHEEEWRTPDERWRPESEYGEYIKALPTVDTDLSAYSDRLWREAYERGKAEGEAERKRGKWISDRLCTTNGGTYGVRRCSECEAYYQDVGYGWNYCPNCGADMRGEE